MRLFWHLIGAIIITMLFGAAFNFGLMETNAASNLRLVCGLVIVIISVYLQLKSIIWLVRNYLKGGILEDSKNSN
jgi:hypothetical protein